MRLRLLSLCLVLLTIASTGCLKKPEACFTTGSPVYTDSELTFKNCSNDADRYEWDFGDGTTSSETSPYHRFINAGTYEVKLTAVTKAGREDKTSSMIVVEPAYGTVTFWKTGSQYYSTVNIDIINNINLSFYHNFSSQPICSHMHSASWSFPPGTYSWKLIYNTVPSDSGQFIITPGGCTFVKLD